MCSVGITGRKKGEKTDNSFPWLGVVGSFFFFFSEANNDMEGGEKKETIGAKENFKYTIKIFFFSIFLPSLLSLSKYVGIPSL